MENQKVMHNHSKRFKCNIEIKNLCLVKQSNYILKNISLKIQSNGFTFIVGPNGSGKTQLARCLHGLEKIEGTIKFNNMDLSEEVKKEQSFVFQYPTILRRSVLDNLILFAKYRKIDLYEDKCISLLRFVKLEKFLDKPALTLSGGEKQRLSLARALITKPKYLFLDEATSHLDPNSVNIIELSLKKINRLGTKIIFISHDINQLKRLANDVILINKGEVIEQSDIKNFLLKPKTKYTKLFLEGKVIR